MEMCYTFKSKDYTIHIKNALLISFNFFLNMES